MFSCRVFVFAAFIVIGCYSVNEHNVKAHTTHFQFLCFCSLEKEYNVSIALWNYGMKEFFCI